MEAAEQWEPDDTRVSRPVLRVVPRGPPPCWCARLLEKGDNLRRFLRRFPPKRE
jgi:hypothetical protein